MARDKLISVRVNSDLYNKVLKIIEDNTYQFGCGRYINSLNGKWSAENNNYRFYRKLSIADILEVGLEEFIKEYEIDLNESNTNLSA